MRNPEPFRAPLRHVNRRGAALSIVARFRIDQEHPMATSDHRRIPGSARRLPAGAVALGPVPEGEAIEVTLRLRAAPGSAQQEASADASRLPLTGRRYLSREQYADAHGAGSDDIARVTRFAQLHGLALLDASLAQRRVALRGTAAQMNRAFGVMLEQYGFGAGGAYRGRIGDLSVPVQLDGIVEGVFGLDDRPLATPKSQRLRLDHAADGQPAHHAYTLPQLARWYNFPPDLDGGGQCIGLIELGGGTRARDLRAYFRALGLPLPRIKSISVDHARNCHGVAADADAEVMLDIEVAGALAPGALIAVYFAPNTERGFLDAVAAAVHDAEHRPSVISISWGAPEAAWTAQAMSACEELFTAAAAMGVTVLCAAGDGGSTDGLNDGGQHVDFPASAPHALACGGTRLALDEAGAVTETVWNNGAGSATGGGYSSHFARPAYQARLKVAAAARGLPDVAGVADPSSGYKLRVAGQDQVFGGTSAVAPLWAGLLALINQRLGCQVGYLHPLLYGPLIGKGATRDVVDGNNGVHHAGPGWDACTGWGCPDGKKLLEALLD
jgi:kumamolisin